MNLVIACDSIVEDESSSVFGLIDIVDQSTYLSGFQLNVVEQWLAQRHPYYQSMIIYTGDPNHRLEVSVYSINQTCDDEYSSIQPLIDQYEFDGLKPFDCELGVIYIAIISNLPPVLNLIPVPEGILKRHMNVIVSNFNLKRMDCMPRTAMIQTTITVSILDKLTHIYHLSHISQVNKLINLVQVALFLFGLFNSHWMDGLLCDKTLEALRTFHKTYEKIGERKRILPSGLNASSPSDTISRHKHTPSIFWDEDDLPSMNQVFSYLLSLLYACRNKLVHIMNNSMTSSKLDPLLHPKEFMADIAIFQQEYGLKVSSKLETSTVELLYDLLIYRRKSIKRSIFKNASKEEDFPISIETNDLKHFLMSFRSDSLNLLLKNKNIEELGTLPEYSSMFRKTSIKKHKQRSPISIPSSTLKDENHVGIDSRESINQGLVKEKKGGLKKAFMKFFGELTEYGTKDQKSPISHVESQIISPIPSVNQQRLFMNLNPRIFTSTTYIEGRYRSNSVPKLSKSSDIPNHLNSREEKPKRWSISKIENDLFYTWKHFKHGNIEDSSTRSRIPIESFGYDNEYIANSRSKTAWVNICVENCQNLINQLLERLSILENVQDELDRENKIYSDSLDQCQQSYDQMLLQLQHLMSTTSKIRYDSSHFLEKFKESKEALSSLKQDVNELDQHYHYLEKQKDNRFESHTDQDLPASLLE